MRCSEDIELGEALLIRSISQYVRASVLPSQGWKATRLLGAGADVKPATWAREVLARAAKRKTR